MITYPNAKINIGLNIVERRNDGFHNISTLFYPLKDLHDILEIVIDEAQDLPIQFSQTGLNIDCNAENNLCIKAYHLINSTHQLPPMKIHLHKLIPTGAGLGGGSADGAFTLKLINDLIGNPLSNAELIEMALKLGSDCPFFIINSPCIGSGRGEILQPSKIDLSGYFIFLVNLGIHVNTGKAYSLSNPKPWELDIDQLLTNDPRDWRNNVINDFEKVVFVQHPEIEKIKMELYSLGAEYAAMSGSGSTVFGIFKSEPIYSNLFKDYFTKLILLK